MSAARISAGCLSWIISAVAVAASPAFDLPQLMAMLARVDRSVVAFEETRHFTVLATPVVRRGTLQYVRPDRLEMRVVTPIPETVEIVGSRIRIESTDGRREWDLAGQPVAFAWIEGIRASLAGDTESLKRRFRIELTGAADAWGMRLEPVDARVAAALARVDVQGRRAQILSIAILDAQGDRIDIALTPSERSPP
jgi:hypothetical protein